MKTLIPDHADPDPTLGNDVDGAETPSVPVKTVDKTSTHTTKRNTDGAAPTRAPAPAGNRRGGGASGNEAGT